jgi:phosphatidylglycerol:prolipoprotein diacylglycerol transferase
VQFLLTFLRQPFAMLGGMLDPMEWVATGMLIAACVIWLLPRRQVLSAV